MIRKKYRAGKQYKSCSSSKGSGGSRPKRLTAIVAASCAAQDKALRRMEAGKRR